MNRAFNSLSRDHPPPPLGDGGDEKLSTPSLGITRSGPGEIVGVVKAFNSLSRDH